MEQAYVVATHTAVTLIVMAMNEVDAIEMANDYYYEQYGEELSGPVAYEIGDYLANMYPTPDVWELPTCGEV